MTTAVVVGGSTGVGRGVADAWAAAGCRVLTLNRTRPTGPGAELLEHVEVDLADVDAARAVLGSLPDEVDLLCYSAVYFTEGRAPLGETTERDWEAQWRINVHGLWLALHTLLPALRRAAPAVVLSISSEVVYNAGPLRAGYAATKAAARGLVESLAQEEDPDVVRVVQALPAQMVDSPGIRARRPQDFDYAGYMTGDDFAPLASHLAQHRAAGLAGEVLVVDHGGSYRPLGDSLPASQSRPAGVSA
ncbi:MAG: SDR family NAD(P)-dependent oxidoreductase [Propionibacteriales bacterium]|nr:SDR family NAD(P)-dependent oxidoreductase [Propionibacteriales bacterium]